MADISTYIREFREAYKGDRARRPILKALIYLNEIGGNASSIGGISLDGMVLKNDILGNDYFDEQPIITSERIVKSNGLYEIYGDARKIDPYDILDEEEEDNNN